MNTTTSRTAHAGDVITMKGRAFYIKDVVNGSLQMLDLSDLHDYTGRPGANPMLREATPEEKARCRAHIVGQYQLQAAFGPGTLVRFKNPAGSANAAGLHVVTANNEKTVTLYPVGGSTTGQYMRAARTLLVIVHPEDVLK